MKVLTLKIHLIEPVLVNQLGGGDPNSAIGFNFIPGSTIRGAIIGKYLKGNQIDANDTDFQRLFLNGAVRFLNAYPITRTNERALPTPVSWHKNKDDEKTIIDFALEDADINKIWKGVSEHFCFSQEDAKYQTWLYDPDTQIKIHTARADRQKVTEGESTIFRYESLDYGQFFSGAILADNESDLDILKTLLDNDSSLNIGKSHLSGYGKVKLETKIIDNWKEYQPVGSDDENLLIITLLSDTIIRDGTSGAFITSIDPVIEFLNMKAKKAFVRTRIMGGFNRTWNLPIPQIVAIQAGSVFVYDNNIELRNYLSQIEEIGIGERRAEGFGRFAIDWNQMKEIEIQKHFSTPPLPETLSKESNIFAGQMVNRMMRAELEQALIKKINNLNINQKPRKSQLNSMRVIARRAFHRKNANDIINYLNGMKKTASSQFQEATIEGKPLSEWLTKIVQQDILYTLNINRDQLPYINDVKPEPSSEINLEYAVRLIDGVLNKALKEADNE